MSTEITFAIGFHQFGRAATETHFWAHIDPKDSIKHSQSVKYSTRLVQKHRPGFKDFLPLENLMSLYLTFSGMFSIKFAGNGIFFQEFFPEVSCLCWPEKLWKKTWKVSQDPQNMKLNFGLLKKKLI